MSQKSLKLEFELGGLNGSFAEGHYFSQCVDSLSQFLCQHTVHFHPAIIFLDYHKPVTRLRWLNELPIDLRWQACVLKMSNTITLMHGHIIRCTDIIYRMYGSAARYAAPWFSFWHASHHAKTAHAKHAGGILRRKRAPDVQLLHQANDITVTSVSKHLAANTEHPAM
jgi:hypothetical protein